MQKTTGKKRRGLTLQKKEAITGWLFVTPAMVGFLIFTAFSMVYSLYISFTNWNILSDPVFVGFQNYRNLFTRDIFFWDYLWNTFYYVLVLVPFVLGAIVGIVAFSKFLKWLLSRYERQTMLLLVGFVLGTMLKICPWADKEAVSAAGHGLQIVEAIIAMAVGVGLVVLIQSLSKKQESNTDCQK